MSEHKIVGKKPHRYSLLNLGMHEQNIIVMLNLFQHLPLCSPRRFTHEDAEINSAWRCAFVSFLRE